MKVLGALIVTLLLGMAAGAAGLQVSRELSPPKGKTTVKDAVAPETMEALTETVQVLEDRAQARLGGAVSTAKPGIDWPALQESARGLETRLDRLEVLAQRAPAPVVVSMEEAAEDALSESWNTMTPELKQEFTKAVGAIVTEREREWRERQDERERDVRRDNDRRMTRQRLALIQEKLGLTEEQRDKVLEIEDRIQREREEIFTQMRSGAPRAEVDGQPAAPVDPRAMMTALSEKRDAALSEVLAPHQLETLKASEESTRDAERAMWRGNRGGDRGNRGGDRSGPRGN